MMNIEQFEIWLADLNPQAGAEAGKRRPVLIVQTDLLNRAEHPSTVICPLTTKIHQESSLLRVHLARGTANISEHCDVMIDQVRAIDNRRLVKKIGRLPLDLIEAVKKNLRIILDLNNMGGL